MISNQILQHTIDGLKNISKMDFCVIDTEGNTLATTMGQKENFREIARKFAHSPADSQAVANVYFFKIFDDRRLCYVLLVKGDSDDVLTIGRMSAFQLQNLLVAYRERYDKENFIKNLLLDNLLLIDIFGRAKKLHIEVEERRVVLIVETPEENDMAALDKVKSVCADRSRDYITQIDERHIAVVKDLDEHEDYDSIQKNMEGILAAFGSEADGIFIACGTIVQELKEISRSYKAARMALDVGKIFFEDKRVVTYSSLGIGRLIYQLPLPLCRMFIQEIFEGQAPDEFDEETLATINKFFENSLNVSETSRQLFIHRNTLVYRLDKLQKLTGLDLRVFEDAITFKIALMVVKYMNYMESQNF